MLHVATPGFWKRNRTRFPPSRFEFAPALSVHLDVYWDCTGPINPLTNSTIPTTNFGLSQSLNLGTRPGLHLGSFFSPNEESEVRFMSPVVGFGSGSMSDDVSRSSAERAYKLCHRGSLHLSLSSFFVGVLISYSF